MQEEVINERAAKKARQSGMFAAMDLCILKEHKARFERPRLHAFTKITVASS
jgi:predicted CoA-binding protein